MSDRPSRTRNADPRCFVVNVTVDQVLTAVANNDRWSIARRVTGPLLRELLIDNNLDTKRPPRSASTRRLGLDNHPLTVIDEDVAICIGTTTGRSHRQEPVSVTAVLVATTETDTRHWLVASLDIGAPASIDIRQAVVLRHTWEAEDLEVIDAAGPLDPAASAIDWNTPTEVLRHLDDGRTYTVGDARTELSQFPQSSWVWLADDGDTFWGSYLRATHPDLVRTYSEE